MIPPLPEAVSREALRMKPSLGRGDDLKSNIQVSRCAIGFDASGSRAYDDRQSGPTGGGYYQLDYEGSIVNAPQGWDQGLED
jgi:hypothetical protein